MYAAETKREVGGRERGGEREQLGKESRGRDDMERDTGGGSSRRVEGLGVGWAVYLVINTY